MKHRKQILSGVLAGMMLMGLAACGQSGGAPSSAGTQSTDQVQEEGAVPAPDNSGADNAVGGNGNVLVAYFSATGNTEEVAGYIADAANGDLFEITPAEPYTSDDLNWSDENSRVSREHADESLRNVELTTTEVENWDSYDTVFIGYPKIQ